RGSANGPSIGAVVVLGDVDADDLLEAVVDLAAVERLPPEGGEALHQGRAVQEDTVPVAVGRALLLSFLEEGRDDRVSEEPGLVQQLQDHGDSGWVISTSSSSRPLQAGPGISGHQRSSPRSLAMTPA